MCFEFLICIAMILAAAPTPVLNFVLDPQNRTPGLGISFDSSLLSANDPDINPTDTKYQDATQSENQEPFKIIAENDSNDTESVLTASENAGSLLVNANTDSLDSEYLQSLSSGRDSLVSNEEAGVLMSGATCVDSTATGRNTKRGWQDWLDDWNPLPLLFPKENLNVCPVVDTPPPKRKSTTAEPNTSEPKKPKEPSRNPTYIETGRIPIINGGRNYGGERSCKDTRPPRLKTLICGGPTVPEGVIPARLVNFCFSCTFK